LYHIIFSHFLLRLWRRDAGLIVPRAESQPDLIAHESHVATATRREAERILEDVTVPTHRCQFPVDVLLFAGGLVALGEILDHVAIFTIVSAKWRICYGCADSVSSLLPSRIARLHANLDAYSLF